MAPGDSIRPEIDRQPFRVAGWRVDPRACRLARDGDDVHIEPKVMQVLVHLADRSGQVVGRRELEELVWTDTVVGYEAVTNAVIKLRKALGDDARHPEIIETIPKRGYRLVAEVTPHDPRKRRESSAARHERITSADPPGPETGVSVSTMNAILANGRRPRPAIALAALLVVLAGALAWWRPWAPEVEPASLERMAYPLPDKPSIAVLPFNNLSGNAEQDFLADGFTENIINSLAKLPDLFVIARNSTFTYKGKAVKVQQVAEDLGVQYVLEGSVQKSEERLRVSAQLIDTLNGHHLWAERYDRPAENLFALQDDITRRIAVAMLAELAWGDSTYIESRSAPNLKAWLLLQQAYAEFRRFTPDGNRKARDLVQEALDQDPNYAQALTFMGWTHITDARLSYSESRSESLRLARNFANKVAAIDPESVKLHYLQAVIYMVEGEMDKAIEYGEKLLRAAPGSAEFTAGVSVILYFTGEFHRSIELMKKALRISPRYPAWYDLYLGRAYAMNREYDSAERAFRRLTNDETSPVIAAGGHTGLAFVFMETGRHNEARVEIDKALARVNWLSVAFYKGLSHFKDPANWQRFATTLRQAGLPKTSG